MSDEFAIQMTGVSKRFRDQRVLDDINLALLPGKIHGIVGRNGSGKTVLMKLICGFMAADGGSIHVNGQVISKFTNIPWGIGAIIEAPGFLPHYSGYMNLRFLANIQNSIGRDEIEKSMMLVGLDPKLRKRVGAYSLGMRQRLGIAQAIMENPPILMLDEPMNGLDNSGVEDMRRLFKALRGKGKTILLASHNPLDIEQLCDTVYEMDAGELVQIR